MGINLFSGRHIIYIEKKQQPQYYQYLQSEIDKINRRDAANKKRAELEVPILH